MDRESRRRELKEVYEKTKVLVLKSMDSQEIELAFAARDGISDWLEKLESDSQEGSQG